MHLEAEVSQPRSKILWGKWFGRLFWGSFGASLLLMLVLNGVGAPLVTAEAPYGIISYELAGSTDKAWAILNSWSPAAEVRAGFSLGLDYLFMLAYPAAISLGCIWAAGVLRARRWPLAGLGFPIALGQWAAALFDAVENIALASFLFEAAAGPWPQIARVCALLKFSLIFLGLVYVLFGAVVRLIPVSRPS